MKTIEQTDIDKSTWGEGAWQHEPDHVQYIDEATGLPCLIVRTKHSGSLCGYVGVGSAHPLFEASYEEADLDVHGGLTFAGKCAGRICHTVEEGENDNVWWLGFDCAHYMDRTPAMEARLGEYGMRHLMDFESQYRTVEYVKEQNAQLAQQLVALAA